MDAIQLREAVTQFYAREAKLLDEGEYELWLETIDEAIEYCIPIRQGTYAKEEEYSGGGYRQRDDFLTLSLRVKRANSPLGYAEAPKSRTVRSVSSIYIAGDAGDIVSVSSALIIYRSRANEMSGDTIHARREDRLRKMPNGLKLLSRTVYLADVSLGTPNLGIFL